MGLETSKHLFDFTFNGLGDVCAPVRIAPISQAPHTNYLIFIAKLFDFILFLIYFMQQNETIFGGGNKSAIDTI